MQRTQALKPLALPNKSSYRRETCHAQECLLVPKALSVYTYHIQYLNLPNVCRRHLLFSEKHGHQQFCAFCAGCKHVLKINHPWRKTPFGRPKDAGRVSQKLGRFPPRHNQRRRLTGKSCSMSCFSQKAFFFVYVDRFQDPGMFTSSTSQHASPPPGLVPPFLVPFSRGCRCQLCTVSARKALKGCWLLNHYLSGNM